MPNDEYKVKFTGESHDLERAGKHAGDALDKTNDAAQRASKSTSNLAAGVMSLVKSWGTFIMTGGAAIAVFRNITASVREALDAVRELGDATQGLATNIGGARADQISRQAYQFASQYSLGSAGARGLIGAAGSMTDLHPDLTNAQIAARLEQVAAVSKAAGVDPGRAFDVVEAAQGTFSMTTEQAADLSTSLLTSGFDPSAATDLIQSAGNAGGVDFISTVMAARGYGLNVSRSGRRIRSVVAALDRRSQDGTLDPDLAALGITDQMGMAQRLALLVALRESGRLTEGQFRAATGGAQLSDIVDPLSRAVGDRQAVLAARAGMLDPDATENAIARQLQSEFVRAADRERNRQLLVEQSQIDNFGTGGAEMIEETIAQLRAQNELGSASLELLMNATPPGMLYQWWRDRSPIQAASRAYQNVYEQTQQAPPGGTVINIGQQINTGADPMTTEYGRTQQ